MSFATIGYLQLPIDRVISCTSYWKYRLSSTDSTIVVTPAPIALEQTWLIDIVQLLLTGFAERNPLTYNPTIHQFVEYFVS
jgi:hypothetical protein